MDRSPLHPLRLLPALLATPDQGRSHFEGQIKQWLEAQSKEGSEASTDAIDGHGVPPAGTAAPADHPVPGTANVPPVGETIPEPGQ